MFPYNILYFSVSVSAKHLVLVRHGRRGVLSQPRTGTQNVTPRWVSFDVCNIMISRLDSIVSYRDCGLTPFLTLVLSLSSPLLIFQHVYFPRFQVCGYLTSIVLYNICTEVVNIYLIFKMLTMHTKFSSKSVPFTPRCRCSS